MVLLLLIRATAIPDMLDLSAQGVLGDTTRSAMEHVQSVLMSAVIPVILIFTIGLLCSTVSVLD